MAISVDVPPCGRFGIPVSPSSTAGDVVSLLRERLPDQPWHGNKVLSCGDCQLQHDDAVEPTRHSTLVLTNYSELSNQEIQFAQFMLVGFALLVFCGPTGSA